MLDMISLLSICMGVSKIPAEVEWPQENKNLVLSNKPTLLFLKSENSGQHTFLCVLLLLLPSVTVGFCWISSFPVSWSQSILWHAGSNSLYPGCYFVHVKQLHMSK